MTLTKISFAISTFLSSNSPEGSGVNSCSASWRGAFMAPDIFLVWANRKLGNASKEKKWCPTCIGWEILFWRECPPIRSSIRYKAFCCHKQGHGNALHRRWQVWDRLSKTLQRRSISKEGKKEKEAWKPKRKRTRFLVGFILSANDDRLSMPHQTYAHLKSNLSFGEFTWIQEIGLSNHNSKVVFNPT